MCKEVPIRETPRGLLIADLLLAVHREDGSQLSDYIPSIMWNGTATRATEKLHVGDCIEAVGRLQSREYIKDLGDRGKEPRTCYELSVNQYELQKKKEEEESRSHEEYLKRIEEDPLWELKQRSRKNTPAQRGIPRCKRSSRIHMQRMMRDMMMLWKAMIMTGIATAGIQNMPMV